MAKADVEEWEGWVEDAVKKLHSLRRVRAQRPLAMKGMDMDAHALANENIECFDGPGPWDRCSVEMQSSSEDDVNAPLLLFSSNDYLALSTHPAVRRAAAEAAKSFGMGTKGSSLICGYTEYHKALELALACLKKKEDSLLCPTGFASNMAFLTALGSISSLLTTRAKPTDNERIAIFSDALNHASIIDGIHLIERRGEAKAFVYKHCDMAHLDYLLSCCKLKKKVVITDSLFSMDGDFAPMADLAELRKKYGFLFVIDDAHGTLTCGKNGGGVAEKYNVESDVDVCIGTLSKAVGCNGGFITSSRKWKTLIQSRGRSYIFSTALSVPFVAAAHAAIIVSRREKWRQSAVWQRVEEFRSATGLPCMSPIIPVVIGDENQALRASKYLLECGYHVTAIRPPTVPANSCRLRIALSAAHTKEDVKSLAATLAECLKLLKAGVKQSDQMDSHEHMLATTQNTIESSRQAAELNQGSNRRHSINMPKRTSKL